MRVWSGKLRASDELPCTIIVKPPLARPEARDNRMTRSCVMFRCMLIGALSQQPHSAHLRRWNHHPPKAKHSTQPVPLGSAAGLIPSLSDFIGSSLIFSCSSSALPRSLQRLELIHPSRNKLRHRGMNVHRALYHRSATLTASYRAAREAPNVSACAANDVIEIFSELFCPRDAPDAPEK